MESYTYYSTPRGNVQVVLYRRKLTRKERVERRYYMIQKALGLAMLAIGILSPIVLDGDAAAFIVAVPLGAFLMATKDKVLSI